MRRIVLATAAMLALFAAGPLGANRAGAMPVPAQAGFLAATDDANLAQDVAYICRRVWHCGPYGCGWRHHCWWRGYRGGPYYRGYHRRYWW